MSVPESLPLLVRVLRSPQEVLALDLAQWDLLLRQAANANLLVSMLYLLEDAGLLAAVPAAPREHLEWTRLAASNHARGVRYEVARIVAALAGLDVPLILLKGGAYAMAGLDAGRGRLFTDIDILVPKPRLDEVEAALMLHGWASAHHDPYDQRYYREWMHEIPPMVHVRRGNAIDVHHAILPETAAERPDPDLLRAAAIPVAGEPGLFMLAPHDMFLHSAVHLFSDGEFDHGLRDLLDLHRLALQFGAEPGFWEGLAPRAQALQLGRPLYYALRYLQRMLGTPVPPEVVRAAAAGGPGPLLRSLMDALFLRVLPPHHPSCAGRFGAAARFALYVRGNWLRMPPFMLARHLFHKAFISPRDDAKGEQA
ncbi:nucleotidyltransferase domain-containing protein [Telluria beijingensis]|uniref:nucleotidyltransferase domain-containing protein n=1 Tax=Telluria beijingensis TaxID=3068633 RepID=UPI0027961FB0|nr:nucleotidyltransferase family protein [Massilia sp. REN29]